MLAQKYAKDFIKTYDKEGDKGQIIKNIIETEEKTNTNLLDWDDTDIAMFLKKFGSVSPQSLNKNMVILRKFSDFICKKEKIMKRYYILGDGVLMQLIDKEQLLSLTLDYFQYIDIKRQLDVEDNGKKINIRDKVIFELAWAGLNNNEIRSIKEENIEFVKSDNGFDIAILNINNNIIRVEDPEVTMDIKLCLKELYCIRDTTGGVAKKTYYKDSQYLIKPINVGKPSCETHLKNPHLALQCVLRRGNITCKGIDVKNLTLTDIKRSRLIYLLAPQNEEFFNFETVAGLYNLKRVEALRWYKKIAKEKYKPVE